MEKFDSGRKNFGFAASRLRGFAASRLRGFAASRLRGISTAIFVIISLFMQFDGFTQGSFSCMPSTLQVFENDPGNPCSKRFRIFFNGAQVTGGTLAWTINGEFAGTGNPVDLSFECDGIFTITVTGSNTSGGSFSCTGSATVSGCQTCPVECDFIATPTVNCGRLEICVPQPAFPGGVHQWDFGQGFATPINPNALTFCRPIFDINTATTSVTVSHQIVSATNSNIILAGPCSVTITPNDFAAANARGIFIGGSATTYQTVRTITQLNTMGLLPSGTYNGTIGGQPQLDVFVIGRLNINVPNYTFRNTALRMDPHSGINIFNSRRLTFDNVDALAACTFIWQGIRAQQGGDFQSTASSIQDAVYGLRVDASSDANQISLNTTDFLGNFIGLLVTSDIRDYSYPLDYGWNLNEFSGNRFEGRLQSSGDLGGNIAQPTTTNPQLYWSLITTLQGQNEFPYIIGYPAYCGVLTKGVVFVVPDGSPRNRFFNLSGGVITRAGETHIRSCRFESIRRFAWANQTFNNVQNYGFGVQSIDANGKTPRLYQVTGLGKSADAGGETFYDVESAVYVGTHKPFTQCTISDCTMDMIQFGVRLLSPNAGTSSSGNIETARVENNTIRVNKAFGQFQPSQLSQNVGAFGIYVGDQYISPIDGHSEYDIEQNEIFTDLPFQSFGSPTQLATYGIYVNGTPNSSAHQEPKCGSRTATISRFDKALRPSKLKLPTM